MMDQKVAGETDDPNFIEMLNSLVEGLLADVGPERFWVIQIDNWFASGGDSDGGTHRYCALRRSCA